LGLRNEIKVVLFLLTISALLGFTQVPIQYAEGAVNWNGFLKQVGFNPPTIYEVSDTTVIPAGQKTSEIIRLVCNDGDWMFMGIGPTQTTINIATNPLVLIEGFGFSFFTDPVGVPFLKTVGTEGPAELVTLQAFDVEVTVSILCLSPSSMMTVGGEWHDHRKRMNILGINAHEKSVSACRLESLNYKITVLDHYLWVSQQLDHIPYMIEQNIMDFDIRNLCILKHERTKNIIDRLSLINPSLKILEVSESDFKNKVGLVRIIKEMIVSKDIVFSKKASEVEEFFEKFSSNASFSNIVEKNEYETSYVWAFILACIVALESR